MSGQLDAPVGLGEVAAVQYNQSSAKQYQILSIEGVHILRVKFDNGPHQYLCSPKDCSPVKIKHAFISRTGRISARFSRLLLTLLFALAACAAMAQTAQTVDQIRVIGNRRIPKETIPGPALHASG